ncbi:MAG: hypothetical protein IJ121_13350 [Eubacterium sp.]|nr:hypothetical protein [Eubacterium sp.]
MSCSIPRHRDRPEMTAAALRDLRGGQHSMPEAGTQRAGLPLRREEAGTPAEHLPHLPERQQAEQALRALPAEQPAGPLHPREAREHQQEIPAGAGSGPQAVRL